MKGALLLLSLALLGCGASGKSAPTLPRAPQRPPRAEADRGGDPVEGRPLAMDERQLFIRLSRQTEELRKLRFTHDVPVRIQTREQALRHLFRELDSEELVTTQSVYVALGLLPESLDVRALLERVLGEQVVGFYDHDLNQLVVRDEVLQALRAGAPEERAQVAPTIVHELVHALQDQQLALRRDNEEQGADEAAAYHALVEGDATLAMLASVLDSQGASLNLLTQRPELIGQFAEIASMGGEGSELQDAPAILRVTLLSSYFDGLMFCATLHRQGGFAAIDRAHAQPPVSTEQVLHPSRYLAGEMPEPVLVPPLPELERAGFTEIDRDRLGELEFRVYFGQREDGVDEAAAAGWGGDQLVAYARGDTTAIVWFSTWDTPLEAEEAEAAAARVQRELPSHRVLRSGRALLIVRELPAELHGVVRSRFLAFAAGLP